MRHTHTSAEGSLREYEERLAAVEAEHQKEMTDQRTAFEGRLEVSADGFMCARVHARVCMFAGGACHCCMYRVSCYVMLPRVLYRHGLCGC